MDISHPNFEEQLQIVQQTLQEIDPQEKPTLLVFNKTDAFTYTPKEEDDLLPSAREYIGTTKVGRIVYFKRGC